MSIPYIPGWWDTISQNAQRFASQLPQSIEPDKVASRRLQEMIQQNPMLLSQIENMTPEARIAMEQTLGFKGQSPLQQLPVGAQLRQQMEEAKYIEGMTPEQKEFRLAARTGTRTAKQLATEEQKIQQDLQSGTLQLQILTGQVKDLNRVQSQIDQAAAKYPGLEGVNFGRIASTVIGGGQVDPTLMTRIQSDPGAKLLYDSAFSVQLTKLKSTLDANITKNSSNENRLLLGVLAEIGNQLNDQEMRTIAEMNAALDAYEAQQRSPQAMLQALKSPAAVEAERQKVRKPFEDRLAQIRKQATDNTNNTVKLLDKMGIKGGSSMTPPPAEGAGPRVDQDRFNKLRALIEP